MKRPSTFAEFHGQTEAVEQLTVPVRAAKARGKLMGHALMLGPRGLGKTTLAKIVAGEMGAPMRELNGAIIEKATQLLPVLTTMRAGEVLFIDEIHAMHRSVFEHLYTVMEDSKVSISVSDDKAVPPMVVELPAFTLIAATTREGLLPPPLLDRFKHRARLQLYSDAEMREVLRWVAAAANLLTDEAGLEALVPACHGTARHAVTLVDAVLDTLYCDGLNLSPVMSKSAVSTTLDRLGFVKGLNRAEVKLLQALASGPKGVGTLAAVLDEEAVTVETVHEPWLLLNGLIEKTPSGRIITAAGRKVLEP